MSICSTVSITKEEALERVKRILLSRQEDLIDLALKSMNNYELTSYLDSDLYYYTITKPKGKK